MAVFLPKTSFNLYQDAKEKEKELLAFWEKIGLENKRSKKREGAKKFVLHDGPPYANGPIHLGHAENKTWKDALNKIFWQSGYDTPYIPGWDSHGLPIETAVEKQLKAEGIDKNTLTREELWDRCYEFSKHWMNIQKEQFKGLGVFAQYDSAYAMFFEPESIGIVECIHKFVEGGLLERRFKPVLWSYAEKTALAYAEVEYKDKISNSIYVLFPILETDKKELAGASLIVWTTTPWTLPANKLVAYNKEFDYIVFEHDGNKYCILESLLANLAKEFEGYKVLAKLKGSDFEGIIVDHPVEEFRHKNTNISRKMVHADFVDNEKGTGFVHIAPAHGEDDFALGVSLGIEIEDLLDGDGCFKEYVPLVGGIGVKDAEKLMLATVLNQNVCVKQEQITHSYPHSWRSKAPLIYRLTRQWFLKIDPIKEKAMKAMDDTQSWVPKEGRNRLSAMVEARQDWCVSRQRIWGVPISIFFNAETGQILDDKNFLEKTRKKLEEIGVKNWWKLQVEDIDSKYSSNDWQRLDDIIEIWFESGSTQYFVLQKNNLFPCDVYLEGSDQHRGWFQSSLLISAFLTGKAPWKHLLTHGFCLDGSKQKMSKSLGNVIDPSEWSADHLRLFFSASSLVHDISMNENSIKNTKEMLFRFRNTIKFILGILAIENINKKSAQISKSDYENLPLLEKWLLHRMNEIDQEYEKIKENFEMHQFANALYEFCAQDLSAFYFDVRKDALYCNLAQDVTRQAAVSCIAVLAPMLLKWFAPIMPFFAEEAWQCYLSENNLENAFEISIHLESKQKLPDHYNNQETFEKLCNVRAVRKQITEKIEELREQKIFNTTSEAAVFVPEDMYSDELKDVAIVASVKIGDSFEVKKAEGSKCTRCRFVYEELSGEFCQRCQVADGGLNA